MGAGLMSTLRILKIQDIPASACDILIFFGYYKILKNIWTK